MKSKWTPEQVQRLADLVRKDRLYRVELRGSKIVEVEPADVNNLYSSFRYAGSDVYHELEEYYPQDFQVFVKEPLKNWWETSISEEELIKRMVS